MIGQIQRLEQRTSDRYPRLEILDPDEFERIPGDKKEQKVERIPPGPGRWLRALNQSIRVEPQAASIVGQVVFATASSQRHAT